MQFLPSQGMLLPDEEKETVLVDLRKVGLFTDLETADGALSCVA